MEPGYNFKNLKPISQAIMVLIGCLCWLQDLSEKPLIQILLALIWDEGMEWNENKILNETLWYVCVSLYFFFLKKISVGLSFHLCLYLDCVGFIWIFLCGHVSIGKLGMTMLLRFSIFWAICEVLVLLKYFLEILCFF